MSFVAGYLPVIPLRNAVLFPGVSMPLRVGRDRSVQALNKALANQKWIVLLTQKNPEGTVEKIEDLHTIGTLCRIESHKKEDDGSYTIFVNAQQRVRAVNMRFEDGTFESLTEGVDDIIVADKKTEEALLESLKKIAYETVDLLGRHMRRVKEWISEINELSLLTNVCAAHADFLLPEKQKLLEMADVRERALKILDLMQEQKERLKIQLDIRQKLTENINQSQKESILREQMRVIREQLGDEDNKSIIDQYNEKIAKAGMPEEALSLAKSQVKRLEAMNSASPEYQIIRAHLDLMTDLPWSKSSEHREIDLEAAEKILNEDHFGMEKVKKRILQHLAVMKLRKSQQGSILLFVGPPGVGKTSLGKSIARALNKKYVRVALGGVRDDAEIRGHRRTYIGAMPGRILSSIKKAGENDPVFVLDEIDKLSRSFNGDPASALLETLDPEQNNSFQDHYLDTPFDLSKVLFIATANTLDTIPGPLLDRMEIIELTGYTIEEKKNIAKRHLWPKQLKEHGIEESQLDITDAALTKVLTDYTREAGVRELQRKIATICKYMSVEILKNQGHRLTVDVKDLDEIFGAERFSSEITETELPPGVVTGLAWTPVGGDILFIETEEMAGTGQLLLTGQLGEVMQESAKIALSLLKARLPLMDPTVDFSKKEIHVHVPAGAIPKDGPSAGVTMLTSIASKLLKKPVNPKLAMTGEISLRGSVLPVGGIKEKIIAAHRAGVTEVILCRKNEKDLREVPAEIKKDIRFYFVDNVNDLLKIALEINFPSFPKRKFTDTTPISPGVIN
ncbi:MAG: endopeptidase La [Bdellovibrio sp.]